MDNRQRYDSIYNNITNGNHTESRKQIKNLSREDRHELILYLKDLGHIEMSDDVIHMCVTGNF